MHPCLLPLDDVKDTIEMVKNSRAIFWLSFASVVVYSARNILTLQITSKASAVVDNCRSSMEQNMKSNTEKQAKLGQCIHGFSFLALASWFTVPPFTRES